MLLTLLTMQVGGSDLLRTGLSYMYLAVA